MKTSSIFKYENVRITLNTLQLAARLFIYNQFLETLKIRRQHVFQEYGDQLFGLLDPKTLLEVGKAAAFTRGK
jgi:hypothetical protein